MGEKEVDLYKRAKLDLYTPFYFIAREAMNRRFDRTVHGAENILERPTIYVANHLRFEDSILLPARVTEVSGQKVRMVGKQEYAEGKGIDDHGKYGRFLKFAMYHAGMIPADRDGKDLRAFQKLEKAAIYHLNQGESVAFHGEGTRTDDDGLIYKMYDGAARLAMDTSTPLGSVGYVYTKYSNGNKTHVDEFFAPAIMPVDFYKITHPTLNLGRKKEAELLMTVIEHQIVDMTGMKHAGKFAQRRKDRLDESKA